MIMALPHIFLSYIYHTSSDSIQVRPKVNWSKKKRGARTAPNVTNEQELKEHFKENPVTKRSCLAITMGTLHDPLYLMGPYQLNLKCLYRKVVLLGLEGDQRIPQNLELELFEILQSFLAMEKVLFPRRVAFIESVLIEILLFFYGRNTAMGISIYIKNHLNNGQIITRLLKNKVK